ncbi:MAG: 1-acyl-sn-glycerol-3-phosphate acyltransferase [Steroidobacteraceae bacterium]|nr:1-acyl-sn-glycerol-3-phosphate acyltransferase [Steroidobacteraceae bacterium]MDW8258286.1 lysophospholipid acyltransferase family protein [Gammaproteobacteria bacterium]
MQLLRSILYTAFMMLWVFACGCVYFFICLALPSRHRYRLARFAARVVIGALRPLCGLGYRIEGQENLPAGAHIALWKHSSTWETFAVMFVFPQQVWVLKRELLWIPFVGWTLRLLHAIGIDRRSGPVAVHQILEQGARRLAEGSWVIVFPEGTRMPPGQTRKYGTSGALLAAKTGRLIVPVAHNAGYYWPRRGLLKKPGTIRVVIGKPIDPTGRDPREINAQVQSWIEGTVAKLAPAG